ncbi:MAG: TOBE domain-containing protein, partial [Pseudomonadota bacterium]|nr:TOBE domain-containing protein [Pseudomonadota bacterium]
AAPAEIYNRPANLFVASFIGTPSMTLIEGELVRRGNQPTLKLGELALPLPVGHAVMDDDTPVRAVTIGVRPEDVVIGSGPIEASVKVVEPTGHESIVLFDMSGAIVTARAGNDVRLRPGEPVRLGFRGDKIHLFDRASGTRINSDVLVAPDTVRAGRV